MNGSRSMTGCVRITVSTVLICVGLSLLVSSCILATHFLPKVKAPNVSKPLSIIGTPAPTDHQKDDQDSLYIALISGCVTLACVTIAGGVCGLCGGEKNSEDSSVEAHQLKPKDKFRSSFRIPNEKNEGDEFVVDDACGNPLFVKIGEDGKPVVRDLGGNVLDVEVGADRMVAVYNAEPPSTDRTRPPHDPPAYTEKAADVPAAPAADANANAAKADAAPASSDGAASAGDAKAAPTADAAPAAAEANAAPAPAPAAEATPASAAAPAGDANAASAPAAAPASETNVAPAPTSVTTSTDTVTEQKEDLNAKLLPKSESVVLGDDHSEAPSEQPATTTTTTTTTTTDAAPATAAPATDAPAAAPSKAPESDGSKPADSEAPAPEPTIHKSESVKEEVDQIIASMGEDLDEKEKRELKQKETDSIITGLDDVLKDINAMWS